MPGPHSMDFLYVLIILCVGSGFFWLVAKLLRIRRSGIPHLGAILVAFALSPFDPLAVVVAALPFTLGFLSGRSTKIALDPTDVFSPRVKLSDEEYSLQAETHHRMLGSLAAKHFFHNPHVHPTQKIPFLFQGFGLYRHARGIALAASWFYITIWGWANMGGGELYLLVFVLSLPFGTAMGFLWKYIKGHPGPPKPWIGGRAFRPTLTSFVLSSLYRMTPAMTAIAVTYFFYHKSGVVLIILDVLTGLFCIYLILQTIIVHLQKNSLLEDGIVISGLSRPYGLRWSDVDKAIVRERHNLLSGTDKLLVVISKRGNSIAYPVSVLSRDDQNEILREVRRKTPTSTVFDNPTI